MRTWKDVALIGLLLAGFLCFVAGYVVMARHVWHMPDRKARLKKLFMKIEPADNYPPLGPLLLGIGAILGVVVFCGFGAMVFLGRR